MPAGLGRYVLLPLAVSQDREAQPAIADIGHRLHWCAAEIGRQIDARGRIVRDTPDAARAGHPDAAAGVAQHAGDTRPDAGQAAFISAEARRFDVGAADPYALPWRSGQGGCEQTDRKIRARQLVGAETIDATTGAQPEVSLAILQ